MKSRKVYKKTKLIYGIAINDADYTVTQTVDGRKVKCKFYETWANMLLRCYNKKYIEGKPTYQGCSVCDEWLVFSNFKRWMEKQDWEGKCLDKDYVHQGNKVYSPDNCIFVTQQINSFISSTITKKKSLSCGVFFDHKSKKFYAKCSDPFTKKSINVGFFRTENEASAAYLSAKSEIAKKIAANCGDERLAALLTSRFDSEKKSGVVFND